MYYIMIGKKSNGELISWTSVIKDFSATLAPIGSEVEEVSVLTSQLDGYSSGIANTGFGNVIGPANESSTNNAIVTWYGTSGRAIKDYPNVIPEFIPKINDDGYAEIPQLASGLFYIFDNTDPIRGSRWYSSERGINGRYVQELPYGGEIISEADGYGRTLLGTASLSGHINALSYTDIINRESYVENVQDGYAIVCKVYPEKTNGQFSTEYWDATYRVSWSILMDDVYPYEVWVTYGMKNDVLSLITMTRPIGISIVDDGSDYFNYYFNLNSVGIKARPMVTDTFNLRIENTSGELRKFIVTPKVELIQRLDLLPSENSGLGYIEQI